MKGDVKNFCRISYKSN